MMKECWKCKDVKHRCHMKQENHKLMTGRVIKSYVCAKCRGEDYFEDIKTKLEENNNVNSSSS